LLSARVIHKPAIGIDKFRNQAGKACGRVEFALLRANGEYLQNSNSPLKVTTNCLNERGRDYHKKPKKFFKGKSLFSLYFFGLFGVVVKNSSFR
jgi:hypothetical protein